MTIMLQVIESR